MICSNSIYNLLLFFLLLPCTSVVSFPIALLNKLSLYLVSCPPIPSPLSPYLSMCISLSHSLSLTLSLSLYLFLSFFHRIMTREQVADMKNSVADRSNAQASCAAQFIGNHIEVWHQVDFDMNYNPSSFGHLLLLNIWIFAHCTDWMHCTDFIVLTALYLLYKTACTVLNALCCTKLTVLTALNCRYRTKLTVLY